MRYQESKSLSESYIKPLECCFTLKWFHAIIIFIDEGNEFIKTEEFAGKIQKTDNYYVIASRESLPSLPYSVEEIYGIKTFGKYGTLKQSYHEFYRIYGADTYKGSVNPEIVITEDSNSGYQFFEHVCKDNGLKCETLNGKYKCTEFLNMLDSKEPYE